MNMIDKNNAMSFNVLAYDDYIAARVLLNNGLEIQGATMASTAIEKYIKVILAVHGKSLKVHMDKLPDLIKAISDCYFDLSKLMDYEFLDILVNVYKIRYVDRISDSITFGFYLNQFLGELDYTVHLFENHVISNVTDLFGNRIKTPYHRDIESKDRHLFTNNYILSGYTKEEHMVKEDIGFSIQIIPSDMGPQILVGHGQKIKAPYVGHISSIKMNYTIEKTTGPNIS